MSRYERRASSRSSATILRSTGSIGRCKLLETQRIGIEREPNRPIIARRPRLGLGGGSGGTSPGCPAASGRAPQFGEPPIRGYVAGADDLAVGSPPYRSATASARRRGSALVDVALVGDLAGVQIGGSVEEQQPLDPRGRARPPLSAPARCKVRAQLRRRRAPRPRRAPSSPACLGWFSQASAAT